MQLLTLKECDPPTLHCAHNSFKNSDLSKITNRKETVFSRQYIFVKIRLVCSIHFSMQTGFTSR